MARISGKNGWALFLLLLVGIVLGGLLGQLASSVSWLSWLNLGTEFGLGAPNGGSALQLNLGFFVITFGISVRITIAGVIGIIAAILIYRKL